jgi:hypothetical protein
MFILTNFGGFPLSTASWGTTGALANVGAMFQSATNSPSLDLTGLVKAGCTTMNSMFRSYGAITLTNVTGLDTSTVTDMALLANAANSASINGTIGEENWNTHRVTTFNSAFRTNLGLYSVGLWNTSSLVDLTSAWGGNNSPSSAVYDILLWDVSKVTTMSGTFLGSFFYNGPFNVTFWNTASLMTATQLFYQADVASTQLAGIPWDVSNWNLQNLRIITSMCEAFGPGRKMPIILLNGWSNMPMLMTANRAFYQLNEWNPVVDNWNAPMLSNIQDMLYRTNANPNISGWPMGAQSTVTTAFNQCYMTKANYDAILLKFASETTLTSRNVGSPYSTTWTPNTFTNPGTLQKYSDSTSRATLVSRSWTLTDGGFEL